MNVQLCFVDLLINNLDNISGILHLVAMLALFVTFMSRTPEILVSGR